MYQDWRGLPDYVVVIWSKNKMLFHLNYDILINILSSFKEVIMQFLIFKFKSKNYCCKYLFKLMIIT